jgi:hypothetical protein
MSAAMDWEVESGEGVRRWILLRPSGYEASIVVAGEELTARLCKRQECREAYALPPQAVPPPDIDDTVARVKNEIEERLESLESGHS